MNLQWVPSHAGISGNKHADSLPKAGSSLATVILVLSELLPKLITHSVTNGNVTFPHFASHLNCPTPTVSSLELVLSRPKCFELSAFASKVKASCNCCKSSHKENSSCSVCGHLLQDHNHLLLDSLASEPLCKSIFGSAVCALACDLTLGSLQNFVASLSLRRGWLAPLLNQVASKIKTVQYALQIVKNNQAIVPNTKKSTILLQ